MDAVEVGHLKEIARILDSDERRISTGFMTDVTCLGIAERVRVRQLVGVLLKNHRPFFISKTDSEKLIYLLRECCVHLAQPAVPPSPTLAERYADEVKRIMDKMECSIGEAMMIMREAQHVA